MRYRLKTAAPCTTGCSPTNPLRVRSLFRGLFAIIAIATMTHTHAELIVHSGSSQISQDNQITASSPNTLSNAKVLTPTDASIIKLMQVMHIDVQIDSIANGQQVAIEAINSQMQNPSQYSEDKLNRRQRKLQTKIQSILGQYTKIMTNSIDDATDAQMMRQVYINAAKAYYTQSEVNAQIEFYDTVLGQSILAKQPQVNAEFLQRLLPDDMSGTKEQVSELLPQMKQLIKDML